MWGTHFPVVIVGAGPTGLGWKLMASYESERRDHAWSLISLALDIGKVMRPPNALAAFVLEYGFLLLSRFPTARDYIAQMKFKPPPRFAQGFVVPDKAGAKKTLVGRMLPQPRVLTENRAEVPLDDVLGPGFAVLVHSNRPQAVLKALSGGAWGPFMARCVVMRPDGNDETVPEGVTTVQVLGVTDKLLARFSDHVLLLRPDRYVAACVTVRDLDKGAAAVAKLVEGTFAN